MDSLNEILLNLDANSPMSNKEIAIKEMKRFKLSDEYEWMKFGDAYYRNKTRILNHIRRAIGENGVLQEVKNLANNKLVHGFTRKLVDQKVGYLLGKPMSIQTDGPDDYKEVLQGVFGKEFNRQIKNLGKNAINCGIAWLHPYYNEDGEFKFEVMPSTEIIPIWADNAHTKLDAIIRFYVQERYEALVRKEITIIELWTTNGVMRFTLDRNDVFTRVYDDPWQPHFFLVEKPKAPVEPVVRSEEDDNQAEEEAQPKEIPMYWERVPFIPFKYNDEELPLVASIKSLVDDYDSRISDNSNNLEDQPESILILKGSGGTKLDEARRNLKMFRMAEVPTDGGLESLSIDIDTTALADHVSRLRNDIFEFGRGVDNRSDKFGSNLSGVALKSLYQDLDLDANIIETEFKASLEETLWFVDKHLYNTTKKEYDEYEVDFIFNRDILINESEVIEDVNKSAGLLSEETRIANHPWVIDVQEEQERKKKEEKAAMELYASGQFPFEQQQQQTGGGEDE